MSSPPKMPSTFTYEKRGKIAIMTINRPDALNAFTAEMLRAMDAVGLAPDLRQELAAAFFKTADFMRNQPD